MQKRDLRALRLEGLCHLQMFFLAMYVAVGFGTSPFVPLQPTAVFILAVINPRGIPNTLKSSMAVSEGSVPLEALLDSVLPCRSFLMDVSSLLALYGTELPWAGAGPSLFGSLPMCSSASK